MNYNHVVLLFVTIFICSLSSCKEKEHREENEMLLQQLDNLIANKEQYVAQKEQHIAQLKRKAKVVSDPEERYWIYKNIYDEYSVYVADSAVKYADRAIAIAKKMNRQNWVNEWLINKSFIYSATGLLQEAQDVIDKVDVANLSSELKAQYYGQLVYLHTHMEQYVGNDSNTPYSSTVSVYLDSINALLPQNDMLFNYFKGWQSLSKKSATKVIEDLSKEVDNSKINTRTDAMNAYILSRLYRENNDKEGHLKYLVYSSMADVRIANRDIASLEELANMMYNEGNLDRAYIYIDYCLQCAKIYKNRVRVFRVATLQSEISKAYQERNMRQDKKISTFLIYLSLLSVVLLISLVYIYWQMRRLSHSRQQVREMNIQLNERVEELSAAHLQLKETNEKLTSLYAQIKENNRQLAESNNVKEKYIGNIFAICSAYISKLDDFRRDINRKIKTKKFEAARAQTETPVMTQNELKELYYNFDAIFLSIYPDFVNEFNMLLRPEERIEVKKGELLNTELRIYALVRLGINDSVKIAKFLHCSAQTVYNNRLRTRNKAVVPKEQFAEIVSKLGKMTWTDEKED